MHHSLKYMFLLLQLVLARHTRTQGRYGSSLVERYDLKPRYPRTHSALRALDDCKYNICENVDDYPEDLLTAILDKQQSLHSYFGRIIEPSNNTLSIHSRNNDEEYKSLCVTRESTLKPRQIRDINGVDRIIANVGKYHQEIKIQTCDFSRGDQCDFNARLLAHKTRCEQHYNIIKLVAFKLETRETEYGKFEIPSTCVCKVVQNWGS